MKSLQRILRDNQEIDLRRVFPTGNGIYICFDR